jgi:hypothetical protein
LSSSGSTGSGGTQPQAAGNKPSTSTPGKLAVSERTAMTIGLNDKLAEMVLNLLANPSQGATSQIFLGVFQVTCQPGSENWKDYIADVNVAVEYGRSDPVTHEYEYSHPWDSGRNINGDCKAPAILAVLPLMDSQSMDLSGSQSNQTQLALTLAAMYAAQPGMQAQANMLMTYVRQQDAQMKSRTTVPTITTYTDGANFGFQIYPAFQAIEDPAAARAGGANVLLPVCFPAVVVLRVDNRDFDEEKPWDILVTHVHTRWIRTRTSPFAEQRWWTRILTAGGIFYAPEFPPSFKKRIPLITKLDDASERMAVLKACYSYSSQYLDLKGTLPPLIWAARSLENWTPLSLPSDFFKKSGLDQSDQDDVKTAKLTIQGELAAVDPGAASAGQKDDASDILFGFVNAPTIISVVSDKPVFETKNQPVVKMVTLDGCQCAFTVLGKNALTLTVPAGSFDDRESTDTAKVAAKFTPHRLTVTTSSSSQASSSTATTTVSPHNSLAKNVNIQFIKTIKEPVSYPSEIGSKPTVTIMRDPLGKVISITLDGNKLSLEANRELLKTIEEILLKSEATHPQALPFMIKNETMPAAATGGGN